MNEGASDHRTAPVDARAAHVAAAVALPDRWRLLELLGSGGQATVWLAEDRTLGQKVALKILPADADERTRARWLEEVRQGRRLSHPNLIRIFDVVETSDRPVAVMEYVPGGTLSDRVVAEGALPVEAVIGWAREVLSVLGYLHDNRIVHRDVKPSNLLVGEDGIVKLSDLGLVRHLDRSSDLTRTLEGVGTPRFMAPEQLRGEAPTASCDLYSLGVTLYQLLTGRLPFEGDSAFQVADGHLHREPPPIRDLRPECPRWLARFVGRLLAKDPKARYPSAERALTALERRRAGISMRTARRLAAGLATMAVAAAGVMVVGNSGRGPIDRVEIEGDEVVARTADNRELWSVSREGEIPRAIVADFVGDAGAEVAVGWSAPATTAVSGSGVVFELRSGDGVLLRSADPEGLGESVFSGIAPRWGIQSMTVGNVFGEGADLVWAVANPRWYSSVIAVTSFRGATTRPRLVLANSGHAQHLAVTDLDGDGTDEILAIALNNPMGFQRVLITIGARSRLTGESCSVGMLSPDLHAFHQARTDVPRGCLSYTPLGPGVQVSDAPQAGPDGIEVVVDGKLRRFDVWGNPEGGLSFGSDGSLRAAFWADLARASSELRLSARVDPPFTMDALRSDHPEIFAERPSEIAAYLVAARALASGTHRRNAISLLRDGVARLPEDLDLRLRLGEQLLIDGQREEGRRWVAGSLNLGNSGRNHNDATQMLILDAGVNGDRQAYEETRRIVANLGASADIEEMGFIDLVWLFFQGRWGDPRLTDADIGWVFRWMEIVQAWASFESSLAAGPALEVAGRLRDAAEVEDLARLLEARVRLKAGEPVIASQLADAALQSLSIRCRMDYQSCAWVPLAEWVLGTSLSSIEGRQDEAMAVLERAAEHAPGTWIAISVTR